VWDDRRQVLHGLPSAWAGSVRACAVRQEGLDELRVRGQVRLSWMIGQVLVATMAIEVDAAGRSFYHPRAFYLSFHHGVLDEHGQPSATEVPVFMHEYAHLVQDQTTLFGVIEFIYLMDTVRDLKIYARANTNGPVLVPLEEHPDTRDTWTNCLARIREVAHAREPWQNGIAWAYVDHEIELEAVPYRGLQRQLPKVQARFINNATGDECLHAIGPCEVKEAYSVAVECLHGGVVHHLDGPEFQYSAVERILAQLGEVGPTQIITICHWALQSQFPGVRLMEIVEHLTAQGHVPLPCANDLHEICRSYSLERGLEQLVEHALNGLDEIVRANAVAGEADPLFQSLRWYSELAKRNLGWCLDDTMAFPADSFLALEYSEFGEAERASFLAFQDEHPIPSMEDGRGRVYATGPAGPGELLVGMRKRGGMGFSGRKTPMGKSASQTPNVEARAKPHA
jgi:hypothetical protein